MVLIPVEDVSVGDYSEEYGTVAIAEDQGDAVYLKFKNGTEFTRSKDVEMPFDQGGRFNH